MSRLNSLRLWQIRLYRRKVLAVKICIAALILVLFPLLLDAGLATGADDRRAPAPPVNAAVVPSGATADHSAPPPGNQILFTANWTVSGMCPAIADRGGEWSTSDPKNTAVASSYDDNVHCRVTCLHATPKPVTIKYGGKIRMQDFASAILVCK